MSRKSIRGIVLLVGAIALPLASFAQPPNGHGNLFPPVPKQYGFDLAILSIDPKDGDHIVEHQPITIAYELTVTVFGITGEPSPMSVSVCTSDNNNCSDTIGPVTVRKYKGTISALAPAAGAHAPVSITAFTPVPGVDVEFPNHIGVAETEKRIPVAARYDVSIDSFTILNTRALHEDQVKVSLLSSLQGSPVDGDSACQVVGANYCVQLVDQGSRNNGTYPVKGVRVGSYDLVPEQSPNLVFQFSVMNMGETYSQHATEVFLNVMSGASAGILNALMSGGNYGGLDSFAKMIHGLDKCDGPVAVDAKVLFNRSEPTLPGVPTMDSMTKSSGHYTSEQLYQGTDSGLGCGSNSQYKVAWSLIRTSWQP